MHYVTFEELFAFFMLLISIIGLIISILDHKKH